MVYDASFGVDNVDICRRNAQVENDGEDLIGKGADRMKNGGHIIEGGVNDSISLFYPSKNVFSSRHQVLECSRCLSECFPVRRNTRTDRIRRVIGGK